VQFCKNPHHGNAISGTVQSTSPFFLTIENLKILRLKKQYFFHAPIVVCDILFLGFGIG